MRLAFFGTISCFFMIFIFYRCEYYPHFHFFTWVFVILSLTLIFIDWFCAIVSSMCWFATHNHFSIVFLFTYMQFIVNFFVYLNATLYFSFIGWAHSCLWTLNLFSFYMIDRVIFYFPLTCDSLFTFIRLCSLVTNFTVLTFHELLYATNFWILFIFICL